MDLLEASEGHLAKNMTIMAKLSHQLILGFTILPLCKIRRFLMSDH
jgi:hypothetical protein